MYVWVVAQLPQRLKSTFFEIFSSLRVSFRDPPLEFFFKKTLLLVFEANSALSYQNRLFPRFSSFCPIQWSRNWTWTFSKKFYNLVKQLSSRTTSIIARRRLRDFSFLRVFSSGGNQTLAAEKNVVLIPRSTTLKKFSAQKKF